MEIIQTFLFDQPQHRMTKEEFITSNRNTSEGEFLSNDLLSAIFDDICANEIKMEDRKKTRDSDNVTPIERQRRNRLLGPKIIRSIRSHFDLRDTNERSPFYEVDEMDGSISSLMFDTFWLAAIATFSVMLETSDAPKHVKLCLKGYRTCIRLSSELAMDVETEAFVSSLASFTLLGTLKPMKQKNIDAIRMLLDIAKCDFCDLRSP